MSTDTDASDGDDDEMTKINVRVPKALLEDIDEKYSERGYTSRSEAIRDALRTWVDPPVQLSENIVADLTTSRKQRERGDTVSAAEARERLGLGDDEATDKE